MTTYLDALRQTTNYTTTENGALTNRSSLDPIVDFFSLAGAMRNNPQGAADLFEKAYEAEPLTAVRTMFYLRDIRGGQGERDVFRACLRRAPADVLDRVAHHIPEFGRWDDIFFNGITDGVLDLIRTQWAMDENGLAEGGQISLMAKWLPSENAGKASKLLALRIADHLDLSPAEYRRSLSAMRARIKLLEHDMSANRWNDIDYGKLPSQAHRKHVKAFKRHTPERYAEYLASVDKGEAKINVGTVYPYEIYNMVGTQPAYANTAWENLPDYTGGDDALVMADVSGSMWGLPMSVSVSLALYFAERNKGLFKGYYMSFSDQPVLVKVTGKTLAERMTNIEHKHKHIGYNTDLSKAFRAILAAALKANEAPPKTLYIISDMEFDQATIGNNDTVFETAKQEFASAGVEMPHTVFWNVNARQTQAPALACNGKVSLVSGLSPTIFSMAVQGKTPRELVDAVVNAERYQGITL